MLYSYTYTAAVGVKGLTLFLSSQSGKRHSAVRVVMRQKTLMRWMITWCWF